MKRLAFAAAVAGCLFASAEDIPWVYEDNHPADRAAGASSSVTLAEAASSGLESSALDFFCSFWCETFDVGLFTILTPRRGATILIR